MQRAGSWGGAATIVVIGVLFSFFVFHNFALFFLFLAAAALVSAIKENEQGREISFHGAVWLSTIAIFMLSDYRLWILFIIAPLISGFLTSQFQGRRRKLRESQSQYYSVPHDTMHAHTAQLERQPTYPESQAENFPSYTEGYRPDEQRRALHLKPQKSQKQQPEPQTSELKPIEPTPPSFEMPSAQYPMQPPPNQY